MLLKLAWRNIWRNKRRTIITLLALSLGVMAIITIHSFREQANDAMVRSLTRGLIGHVQVHAQGYRESPEVENAVADPVDVEHRLRAAVPGARSEKRVLGAGLGGAGDRAGAVMVMGIEPENPDAASLLTVDKGRALGTAAAREAVVGSALAEELGIQPGGELVLVSQAADGSLANDRFTVVGTADAGSYDANASAVFLHIADAQSFFGLGEGAHQIVLRLPVEDDTHIGGAVTRMRGAVGGSAVDVEAWYDIVPELKSAMDQKAKNSRLMDVIVFIIVSLGVLNTMTMSTFERTREFGVLRSLGTRRGRILGMVTLEALLQGVIGFAIGLALAYLLLLALGPVSFESLAGNSDVLGVRMPEAMRFTVQPGAAVGAALTTLLTVVFGGLLPAYRASRLKPVEATRYV